VDEWLERARDRIAAEAGVEPSALALSEEDARALLELARVAAHGSGERTNAPLACYLAGIARGQDPALELSRLVRAVSATSE
jgi:hypothetical protein